MFKSYIIIQGSFYIWAHTIYMTFSQSYEFDNVLLDIEIAPIQQHLQIWLNLD